MKNTKVSSFLLSLHKQFDIIRKVRQFFSFYTAICNFISSSLPSPPSTQPSKISTHCNQKVVKNHKKKLIHIEYSLAYLTGTFSIHYFQFPQQPCYFLFVGLCFVSFFNLVNTCLHWSLCTYYKNKK